MEKNILMMSQENYDKYKQKRTEAKMSLKG